MCWHHICTWPRQYPCLNHVGAELHTCNYNGNHYDDVIMSTMASQITSLTIVYSTVYLGAEQKIYQSSVSLDFVRGIHREPVNSPHKWPVTRKIFHLMTSSWVQSVSNERYNCRFHSTANTLINIAMTYSPLPKESIQKLFSIMSLFNYIFPRGK